jgi:dTDP-4-dehydrorhamnose reductase
MGLYDQSIAVLGGRGMLGTDLCQALRAAGCRVTALDLPEFDITAADQTDRALTGVAAVVNCAAYTNVDGAEAHRELAAAVNERAVGQLGQLAAARGVYVLHISTDFVFDGDLDRPYRETDAPRPISVYGASKLAGEQALQAAGGAYAIVRVQWTYGRAGQNFISKFLNRADTTDDLAMVADQVGAPTWTGDVSAALLELLERRRKGLYHYAAAGYASRFEVAEAILAERGLRGKRLRPCRTADFPAAARRPLNSRFDCAAIDAVLARPRPHWRAALAQYLAGG